MPYGRAELGELRALDPIIAWNPLRKALFGPERKKLTLLVKQGFRRERELVRAELRAIGPLWGS